MRRWALSLLLLPLLLGVRVDLTTALCTSLKTELGGVCGDSGGGGSAFSLEFGANFSSVESAASDVTVFDFEIPNVTTHEFSLAGWQKSNGVVESDGTLLHLGDISVLSSNRFMVQNNSSIGRMNFDIQRSTGAIKRYQTSNDVTPRSTSPAWFHYVITYDGGNLPFNDANPSLKLFVDGVIVTAWAVITDQDITGLVPIDMFGSIGNLKEIGEQPARHLIFSQSTWDSELSQAEITELAANPQLDPTANSGNYVSSANNKSHWMPGRQGTPNLGKDYGVLGIDFVHEQTIDDSDRSADIPL